MGKTKCLVRGCCVRECPLIIANDYGRYTCCLHGMRNVSMWTHPMTPGRQVDALVTKLLEWCTESQLDRSRQQVPSVHACVRAGRHPNAGSGCRGAAASAVAHSLRIGVQLQPQQPVDVATSRPDPLSSQQVPRTNTMGVSLLLITISQSTWLAS